MPLVAFSIHHGDDRFQHDARASLSPQAKAAVVRDSLFDILYADDTLLLGASARYVAELAQAIEREGQQYGMALHWGKTQAISVCTDERVCRPDGTAFDTRDSLIYLGGVISRDGRIDSELSRRIGIAGAEFRQLQAAWNHAGLTSRAKVKFFTSFVVSKLLYGLSTIWLVTAQLRRLEGFYTRRLRKVLRIPPAYVSRVSNVEVFRRAGVQPIRTLLLQRQLLLLGRVGRSPANNPMRRDTFVNETARPQVGRYVRRVGRPRQDWTTQLLAQATRLFGGSTPMEAALLNQAPNAHCRWKVKCCGL